LPQFMKAFEFHGNLFEFRAEALEALEEKGYVWLSHFSSIDPLHDLYGLEVCGIRDKLIAVSIQKVLLSKFAQWKYHRIRYKDYGREVGWKVIISKSSEDFTDNYRVTT